MVGAAALALCLVASACARSGVAPAAAPAGQGGAPRAFRHPGIMLNGAQLRLLRDKVAGGQQPWAGALEAMKARYGSLTWVARPRAEVNCGPYSRPNNGCSDERNDAVAAYGHALLWQMTGQAAHAGKAMQILDAWAAVLRDHTGHNARLQAGWAGSLFPRAGELLRQPGSGWPPEQQARFASLLRQVFLPMVTQSAGGTNGNWDLVMIEAALDIGVFLDDRAVFDAAVARWRRRVPAYFYLGSDGPRPVPPPPDAGKSEGQALITYWHEQTQLVDGLSQETCRDFGHTSYGIASAISVAETAFQQGVDLYQEQSARLRAALEFHAGYLLGEPAPPWLCGGKLDLRVLPTWEIGFNHFNHRLGLPLPLTERLIATRVRGGRGVDHHIVWETFTHAGVGWAGLR